MVTANQWLVMMGRGVASQLDATMGFRMRQKRASTVVGLHAQPALTPKTAVSTKIVRRPAARVTPVFRARIEYKMQTKPMWTVVVCPATAAEQVFCVWMPATAHQTNVKQTCVFRVMTLYSMVMKALWTAAVPIAQAAQPVSDVVA